MREIIKSNDPVLLSFAASLLSEAGFAHHLAHSHSAILDGSNTAIQQSLLVDPAHFEEAQRLLVDAGAIDPV